MPAATSSPSMDFAGLRCVTKAAPVEAQLPGHAGQLPGKPTVTLATPGSGSSRASSPPPGIGGMLRRRGGRGRH